MKKSTVVGALFSLAVASSSHATLILSEGFEDVTTLAAAGWVTTNNSSPVGRIGWFQGNTAVFNAASGPLDSYIASNFNNAAPGGNVSNWLITPTLAFIGPATLSFAVQLGLAGLGDTLEVYYAGSDTTNVGSTDTSIGDFTLLDTITTTSDWANVTLDIGTAGDNIGRVAFRYVVANTSLFGDYIGIDSVQVNGVPEPTTTAMVALALAGLALSRRRA